MVQAKGIVGINALRKKAAFHVRDPGKEAESLQEREGYRMQCEGFGSCRVLCAGEVRSLNFITSEVGSHWRIQSTIVI